jgi:hypothetical protein
MQYAIETIESTNFGDHGERVRRSHAMVEGETVEQLIARVFPKIEQQYASHDYTDELIIRVIEVPEPAAHDPWAVQPPSDGPPF